MAVLRQHRQRVLLVVRDALRAVRRPLIGENVGIAAADDVRQSIVFPCNDEILQVDGAGVHTARIHHIQRGDVVVDSRLPHQLAHGLADGQRVADAHKVAAHPAADILGQILLYHIVHHSRVLLWL